MVQNFFKKHQAVSNNPVNVRDGRIDALFREIRQCRTRIERLEAELAVTRRDVRRIDRADYRSAPSAKYQIPDADPGAIRPVAPPQPPAPTAKPGSYEEILQSGGF